MSGYTESTFPEPSAILRIPLQRIRRLMAYNENVLVHRYVNVPCPSGKHQRSIVTFRDHTVAAMFCIPCEYAWAEPTTHPALRNVGLDRDPESNN